MDFVWGDTVDDNKIDIVVWGSFGLPKLQGGLGISSAKMVNQAFFFKIGWKMISNRKDLCVQTLRSK